MFVVRGIKCLTAVDLDASSCQECGDPECPGGLYIHAGCHPHEPLIAHYLDGILWLYCGKCEKPVVPVAVMPGGAS